MPFRPIEQRLATKTVTFSEGCWVWTGCISNLGYSRCVLRDGKTSGYAHRVMYELVVGPIPDEYEIDHLCRNRWCVRPNHLEAVTLAENRRRRDVANKERREKKRLGILTHEAVESV